MDSSLIYPSTNDPNSIALKISELAARICLCPKIFSEGDPASPPAIITTSENSSENSI